MVFGLTKLFRFTLTHEDLLLYRRFLADPHWRPFAGPLSAASAQQAFTILNTLFAWLVNAGYLAGNSPKRRQKNVQNHGFTCSALKMSNPANRDGINRRPVRAPDAAGY